MSNGLQADAIKEISGLTERAGTAQVLALGGAMPPGLHYVTVPGGKVETVQVPPGPVVAHLTTPNAFSAWVKARPGVVFLARESMDWYADMKDRRERAVCDMSFSEAFKEIQDGTDELKQADFLRLLRVNLHGCIEKGLSALLSQVKYKTEQAGAGVVGQGRESIDRSTMAELTGADKLPESTLICCPIWRNFGFTPQIECALILDPYNQTFQLEPLAGEIDRAFDAGLTSLRVLLDAQTEVHFGSLDV